MDSSLNIENSLKNIKSKYILMKIFDNLKEKRLLKLINYNKNLQNKLDIGINNYKKYHEEIEIEIIPNEKGDFRDLVYVGDIYTTRPYYHVYLNDQKEETENISFEKTDNIKKIKIIIDKEIKSLDNLFCCRDYMKKLTFIKFYRKDIENMSNMFSYCRSLKELNLSNLITDNVTNMSGMFRECNSLEKLNLNNFNTKKVTNMSNMFAVCKSLKELKMDNFDSKNVKDMTSMFSGCQSLKELNLEHFKTNNLKYMSGMFSYCSSLQTLNIKQF